MYMCALYATERCTNITLKQIAIIVYGNTLTRIIGYIVMDSSMY